MQPIIVFDFDGVIVSGAELTKQKCWVDLIQPQGEKAMKALTRALERYSQGRGSRYNVISYILHDLDTPENRVAELVETYSNKYGQKVKEEILAEGILNEDRRALDFLAKKAKLFINTATVQSAIEEMLDKLGVRDLFKGVYGPGTNNNNFNKAVVLQTISNKEAVSNKNIIFIGDGEGDRKASIKAGCQFIGIGKDYNGWTKSKCKFPVVGSISEAAAFLFPEFLTKKT